jgi:hypothetical protein
MYEAEIMIIGYTILVSTTTVVISQVVHKKRLKKIKMESSDLKAELLRIKIERESQK